MGQRPPERILRVGQLNRYVRVKLERWGQVWVEGELSDVSRASSGHLYFCLNDGVEPAQIRAVMFRGDARFAKAEMRDGERVRVRGRFTFYEPRGGLQIVVRLALPAGEGDRREQLARLKKKLAKEGLFAPARKRRLPRFPSVVGVVTSRRGAALHDVVRVASGRAPVRLVVAHCQVQGPDAPASIRAALRRVARVPGLEVVILTRGGGASEDLAAFDDEAVARAVAALHVPVVSGVGHEVDETVVDLVADVRAATPSNAAELVVPDRGALAAELASHRRHLEQGLEMQIGRERLRLERLARRLADPRRALGGVRQRFFGAARALERAARRTVAGRRQALNGWVQRLGRLDPRTRLAGDRARLARSDRALERAVERRVAADRHRFQALAHRLRRQDPRARLDRDRARLEGLRHRLEQTAGEVTRDRRRRLVDAGAALRLTVGPTLGRGRAELAEVAARLSALSPLRVLGRGYAIALHEPTGRALTRAEEAAIGDRVRVRLARGTLLTEVRAIEPGEDGRDGDGEA
ncbi:MAG TPA: exodeoxyribonuclease VII large subunit [Sandaracinaceae bacterium LLY-WYZ-13_1]|nr:exodeoxyribonuclease VII large subunit [Sandaracinaceae bacterium LLY-WYZ-13_1]